MKTDIMRIELIFGLLGLVCWMTAGQEIHPDEMTTEWLTTDVPTTMAAALDAATTSRTLDSRARILQNSELEEEATLLAASQTSIPSVGSSTLDNSLRSTNNNDWTPIVWPSTRLVTATPLASPPPVTTRPTAAPGPSTLVIRPTPLLRPLPTIVAAPARVSSTQRTVSTSARQPSTENTPTLTRPPVVSTRPVVHFDLEDASSGPNFTIVANPEAAADSSISPSAPVLVTTTLATAVVASNNTREPIVVAPNTTTVVPIIVLEEIGSATNATGEMEIAIEEFIESLNETIRLSVDNETLTLTLSDTTSVSAFNSTLREEEEKVFPSTRHNSTTGLANSSFVTLPSHNDTVLVTEDELFEQEFLTTPLEENPMTTDLSTGPNNDSVVELSSSSSAFEEDGNATVVLSTEAAVPSTTSHKAAISVTTTTGVPVTSQPSHVESTSVGHDITGNGKEDREESGRSTTTTSTLSVLSGLSTIFPALTRPPSTSILPTEISKPITTSTTTTTAPPTTTTASIVFHSSVWTVAPQPAPPTPSVPHFGQPQGTGWPTTIHPTTQHDSSIPFFAHPSSTEYYPDNEWPSTEGSSQFGSMDNTATIVAVSVSIAVILVIAIVLLLLLVLRRRRARAVQGTCQPARMDAYSLDNVSQSNTWQRGKVRNSLRASKRSYLNQAFDDSTVFSVPLTAAQLALYMEKPITSIEAEFRNIATSTVRIDELPVGVETKNRYANVLPVPETRVHIRVQDNQPTDTIEQYINANYIKGPKEEINFYIACQGPMEETVQDFWQMIWENQCKLIIQLTDLSENGVARCAEYLPPSEVLDCHRLYGDYQVTLKSRELRDNYVSSHVQLKRMEDNLVREITHLWYSSWPATGVPDDGKTVVALLMEARKGQSKENKAPMIVHCSPGTGRTGAVLAIDICMRHLDSSRSIDIPRSVHRLRQDRAGCVQTGEQYAFIYKAVNHYASQLSNAALDSL